jgi:phage terminase large subunit-like protein
MPVTSTPEFAEMLLDGLFAIVNPIKNKASIFTCNIPTIILERCLEFQLPQIKVIHIGDFNVLWPERRTEAEVLDIKATTIDHVWETTYQGNPTSPHGNTFQREWWHHKNRFDERTPNAPVWISFDTAFETTEAAAKSSMVAGELTQDYKLKIIDVWSDKVAFPDLQSRITLFANKYNQNKLLNGIIIENKGSGISIIQALNSSAALEIVNKIYPFTPKTSKDERWSYAANWCNLNMVLLPNPSPKFPWLFEFEKDLFDCPDLEYKDVMDSFAQLVIYLELYLSAGYRGN